MPLDLRTPGDIIKFPTWEQPNILQSIESRIDSALSSSNGVLNYVLSPVRDFVHNVLHPVVWVADQVINVAWSGVKWVFGGVQGLAYESIWAVSWVIDQAFSYAALLYREAVDLAQSIGREAQRFATGAVRLATDTLQRLIDDVARYTGALITNLRSWVSTALDYSERVIMGAVDGARRFATNLVDDLRQWAANALDAAERGLHALVDESRRFVGAVIDDLRHWATTAIDDVREWAGDAIGLFYDDIVRPLADDFANFVSTEWDWAKDLLHLVDQASDWLWWITRHVVGDAIDLWEVARGWLDLDLDDVVRVAAGAHNAVAHR